MYSLHCANGKTNSDEIHDCLPSGVVSEFEKTKHAKAGDLAFLLECLSGSRLRYLFLLKLDAAISVASTMLPSLNSKLCLLSKTSSRYSGTSKKAYSIVRLWSKAARFMVCIFSD